MKRIGTELNNIHQSLRFHWLPTVYDFTFRNVTIVRVYCWLWFRIKEDYR